jgi:hypothetical protein
MISTVTLSLRKPDGSPLSGVSVQARYGAANHAATTDSDGVAQWSIEAAERPRVVFLSSDSSQLNGLVVRVPNTPTYNVGTFIGDAAAESDAGNGGGGGGGSYEVATESPATGSNATFTFTGPPTLVFRNGVMEMSLGTVAGNTFVFDSNPNLNDVVEGLV